MKKPFLKATAITVMLATSIFQASAVKEPVTAAEAISTKRSVKKYYVTSDILSVRSGPGTDYPVIGSLTRGMKVKVTSVKGKKGNRWAKIKFQGLTAYTPVKHLAKK